MLHALGRSDEGGVEHVGVGALLQQLLAFLQQPLHSLALVAAQRLADALADLLEAAELLLGLTKVLLEALPQLGVLRLLDHFRQRLDDLLLGAVQILELLEIQVLKRFESHCSSRTVGFVRSRGPLSFSRTEPGRGGGGR